MTGKSILISGGSVAGPALALLLARNGWNATIVERAPAPRPGGYKVDLRGVSVRVADLMGIGDRVRANETDIRGGDWLSDQGKKYATHGPDMIGFRDPGDLEILRGDLAEILREESLNSAKAVTYVYGDAIASMREDADGVHVVLESGAEQRYDLVVGADGLHSGVRELAFGPEEEFLKPLGLSVAVMTAKNTLGLDRWEMACSSSGHTVDLYALSAEADAQAQFFFPTPAVLPDRRDRAAQERVLAESFAGHGWEVPRLLRELPDTPELYFDHLGQIELDSWSRGRIALVGDAAYCPSPASGQGTGTALVGAYVLAQELVRADGDHTVAYARYEERMRPYVELNLKLGRYVVKKMVPGSKFAAWGMRLTMRMMPYMPGKKMMMEAIMKPIRAASNAIEVDGYGVGTKAARARG